MLQTALLSNSLKAQPGNLFGKEATMTVGSLVGASVRRKEDPRLVQGMATYVGDISLPGLLHARFVRSPYAHARFEITGQGNLGTDAHFYSWNDFKDSMSFKPLLKGLPNRPFLADGEVRMSGEPVGLVVASSLEQVYDLSEKIEVKYEPLPVAIDPEEAVKPGAPKVHAQLDSNLVRVTEEGDRADVEARIKASPVVVEQRIYNQRVAAVSLEARGIVADYNRGTGQLTIWLSNQAPHLSRSEFSKVLKIPEHKIRVIAPEVGGGFGSKIMVYPEELIIAAAAVKLGRPVKWLEGRSESMAATYHGRCQIDYLRLGATEDGIIQALDLRLVADIGAYASDDAIFIPTLTTTMASGCYAIPAISTRIEYVFTNTTPTTAYRGAGRPEAAYFVERIIDELAARLNMDPVEIRLRNFIKPEAFPYKSATGALYDSGEYASTLQTALDLLDYPAMRQKQAQHKAEAEAGGKLPARLLGIGIGSYVERGAMGFENAVVRINPDGSVSVFTGVSPHGQGSETTMAQIVADTFGIEMDRIEVSHGDTKDTPYGQGTYGSRSAAVGGSAVKITALSVKDKIKLRAAHRLEAAEADIEMAEGQVFVKGVPNRSVSFEKVVRAAYNPDKLPPGMEIGLESSRFFNAPDVVFPFGSHVCALEIDTETLDIKILNYVSVDDCGTVINPMIVDGQVHGGIAQGISQALYEQVVYDQTGQILSGSLMDYSFPNTRLLPNMQLGRTFTPSPRNPLGAKGIGESGATGSPPAVVNAVLDALRPYGISNLDMPLWPDRLWKILNDATGKA
jgi:carbon-monoxide dehydrogenase large subunit